jgi:CheY-like chemotaxis protein
VRGATERRIRVFLVVEDDADMRLLITLVLRGDPRLDVVGAAAATTAEAALASARTFEPGLIILDHALGGHRTGLDVAPQLKARYPQAKILLYSAYDLTKEAKRCTAVDEYLDKGDIRSLLPTVQRMFDLSAPPTET